MFHPSMSFGEANGDGELAPRPHRSPPNPPPTRSAEPVERVRAIEYVVEPDGVAFQDAHGVRWRVVERDARRDPGARAARCLVFQCGEVVRRVWDYPAGWRRLPHAALVALSWER